MAQLLLDLHWCLNSMNMHTMKTGPCVWMTDARITTARVLDAYLHSTTRCV